MKYRIKSHGGTESHLEGVGIVEIPDAAEFVDVEWDEDSKNRTTAKVRYLVPEEDSDL